jgi:hypothetical protein
MACVFINHSDIEALPVGIRIVAGILQSTAVRAAGFAIVPLNSLAPAVKVLYVVMRESQYGAFKSPETDLYIIPSEYISV